MKNMFYFIMLANTMIFAACSSEEEVNEAEPTSSFSVEFVTIGVGLPGSETTRLYMNELTDMVWEIGDHLDVYGYKDGVCQPPITFTLVGGDGTSTGVFSGESLSGFNTFELSHKGAAVKYSPEVEHTYPSYSYLDQTQTAMNNFEHIKDHMLMRSGKVTDVVTNKIIQLKPQCSILKINVKNLPDEIKDIEKCDVIFYLTNPPKSWIRNAKVHLSGRFAAGKDNFVYMTFEPGHDLDAGGELSIGFDVGGKEYKACVTSANGKNYEPGVIYTVTLDYKNPGKWIWVNP